jgi:UDP-glucose 4-epimerase
MKKKVILITGGSGYIGTHLIHSMKLLPYRVVSFDLCSPKIKEGFDSSYIQGDISDVKKLDSVFLRFKPDCVVHLAAKTKIGSSKYDDRLLEETNVCGARAVLSCMKKYRCERIVFASSASVYGNYMRPVTEVDVLNPMSEYGKTKKTFEEDIVKHAGFSNYVILRLFNVVGNTVIPDFITDKTNTSLIVSALRVALGKQKTLSIFGDGSATRDYVFIGDVVEAFLVSVRRVFSEEIGGIFNIGSGTGTSCLEVVQIIENGLHIHIPIVYRKPRLDEIVYSVANTRLAQDTLGWKLSGVILKDIISAMVSHTI